MLTIRPTSEGYTDPQKEADLCHKNHAQKVASCKPSQTFPVQVQR
jgi:hypothetical protein